MKRIFLAGATGVIGRNLLPLLSAEGYHITGTTRSPEKARELQAAGIDAVVVDMFDAGAVMSAVREAKPHVLIHQLTDLPKTYSATAMEVARIRNARLREETAPTLMRAAREAGVQRVIVQSICFAYVPGALPHRETDPLIPPSVRLMEATVFATPNVEGIVLRYGQLWGPGTWSNTPTNSPTLHVAAAAHAALLAITRGAAGVYNIAEPCAEVDTTKARTELGFDPGFRL